jgi:RNA recognition motif-containing protein
MFEEPESTQNAIDGANNSFFASRRLRVERAHRDMVITSKTLFIGNLPYDLTDAELTEFFSRFDKDDLVDVRVAMGRDGNLAGFLHADFVSLEASAKAFQAIATDSPVFRGRRAWVDYAGGKRSNPSRKASFDAPPAARVEEKEMETEEFQPVQDEHPVAQPEEAFEGETKEETEELIQEAAEEGTSEETKSN